MTDVLEDVLEPAPEDVVPEPEPEPEVEPVIPEGADNPDAVKALITAERNRAKEANRKARDLERQLRERDDAAKPLAERVTEADAARDEANLKAMRLEVALDKGLSLTLSKRLSGSTKDELEADADELVSLLGAAPRPDLDGGYKPPPPKDKDPNKAHNAFIAGILQGAKSS